jgi:hypothetical protein
VGGLRYRAFYHHSRTCSILSTARADAGIHRKSSLQLSSTLCDVLQYSLKENIFQSMCLRENALLVDNTQKFTADRNAVSSLKRVNCRLVSRKRDNKSMLALTNGPSKRFQLDYQFLTNAKTRHCEHWPQIRDHMTELLKNASFQKVLLCLHIAESILDKSDEENGLFSLPLMRSWRRRLSSNSNKTFADTHQSRRHQFTLEYKATTPSEISTPVETIWSRYGLNNVHYDGLVAQTPATSEIARLDEVTTVVDSFRLTKKANQVKQFLELLSHSLHKALSKRVNETALSSSPLQIQLVDLCCGKSYLTAAAHAFLTNRSNSTLVQSIGLEVQPSILSVIDKEQQVLCQSNPIFCHMQFRRMDMTNITALQKLNFSELFADVFGNKNSSHTSTQPPLRIAVALHACDTLSDNALYVSIRNQCDIVLVVPCCHKEIRRQLKSSLINVKTLSSPIAAIMRYGVHQDRMSEMITDTIRASILQDCGYDCNVVEFIGREYTAKNNMIVAVKAQTNRVSAFQLSSFEKLNMSHSMKLLADFGLTNQHLIEMLTNNA